jgi:CxxC motif-containing protein (DUF1111 family)
MRFSLQTGFRVLASAVLCTSVFAVSQSALAEDAPAKKSPAAKKKVDGRAIFAREWIPGDQRSHGGDGLGPMFNESSCVACHNQGGVGGAGPASKNVDIVTAFHNRAQRTPRQATSLSEALFKSVFGQLDDKPSGPKTEKEIAADKKKLADQRRQQLETDRKALVGVHPGFAHAFSVVLHKRGAFSGYDEWRASISGSNMMFANRVARNQEKAGSFVLFDAKQDAEAQDSKNGAAHNKRLRAMQQMRNQMAFGRQIQFGSSQIGHFAVTRSQRNTTALFGAGVIDAIPVKALKALEEAQKSNKEISGRVAMLKNGKIGRFGWKGQTASLEDFVLTACAVELGLNVPDHPQAGIPQKPKYKPAGLDLNSDECQALIGYVGSLPAPAQRELADATDAAYVNAGHKLFTTIGCAACHTDNVGDAKGVFSDLLLHDMGEGLGDTGSYDVFIPDTTPDGGDIELLTKANGKPAAVGATRLEWRTAPLWGVRDSAPYLHDGRADTLEQAIVMHGGESAKSAERFFGLSDAERFQVVTFMKSLIAPTEVAKK